ncbi:formate--tetrahydrofolate ligase [Globicatella sanguinis]|uniref:formate--tetrahydrofolate ligase n=1 Tax=Globicatella sanguinis TaxID=13076 RepID=UPI002542BAC0|nr:formate--tetrahydrofolate ligase [Globicatella sanguinis]MDK7631387.1 formate--tetrahydrofolate ligase [Globicatella sanguinis]WIK65945.1 formate--tetrahydrofolate ligase [Globicatella sanguinis]WKT55350.1 formate--tetrahydrofolate ligase [Globicatella sanguinis]
MSHLTDIEIAHSIQPLPIQAIADKLGIQPTELSPYGHDKAKVLVNKIADLDERQNGKLILVTAISPTPAGEGKTTVSVGLADGLRQIGKNAMVALREPSLGPVFGMKGGAAGGGYSQVIPMEDINLHFTGDFHAISATNNLVAAALDNHINHGNELDIDVRSITWKRVVDMNDRQLRYIVSGLGKKSDGFPHEDGFDITVASEIMSILCLAENMTDLKSKLGRIIVAYNNSGEPVTVADLQITGALAILMKDAINPNLVQTLEGTPAFIHGGPFANIAHGCNSIIATKAAMKLADYTVTEAGFGADLGAEKFMDIKCRLGEIEPDAVVVVATIRALKMHGGVKREDLSKENVTALEKGVANLRRHVQNVNEQFGKPVVVAINKFATDTEAEFAVVQQVCHELEVEVALSDGWANGGKGNMELAEKVVVAAEKESKLQYVYQLEDTIEEKLQAIVQKIYGGRQVKLTPQARRQARRLTTLGFDKLPICMAKTQYSFTDNPKLLGAPTDFEVTVRHLKVYAGAGFIVALTGDIMTMPGLPKVPAANHMDITEEGTIIGLS